MSSSKAHARVALPLECFIVNQTAAAIRLSALLQCASAESRPHRAGQWMLWSLAVPLDGVSVPEKTFRVGGSRSVLLLRFEAQKCL